MRCNRVKMTDMRPIMKKGIENADVTILDKAGVAEALPATPASAEIQAEVAKVAHQLWQERGAEGDLAEQDWRRARVIVLERLAVKGQRHNL
jgi:hypothetical protein